LQQTEVNSPTFSLAPVNALDATFFDISFPSDPPQDLTDSIAKVGILTPLVTLRKGKTLRLLDGHKRLKSARALDIPQIPVAILSPSIPPDRILSFWFTSQRAARSLTPFELAGVILRAPEAFHLSMDEIHRHITKESGLTIPPQILPALPEIMNLPEELKKEAIQRGYSAAFLVKIVSTCPAELLSETALCLKIFSLSENQLDALLTWLEEITRRDGLPVSMLIHSEPLAFILRHPKMPSAKKRDAFLKAVYRIRFPRRAALDKAFLGIRQKLSTAGNITLVPPREFTGDRFELKISFRDSKDLQATLEKIGAFRKEIEALSKLI